MKKLSWIVLLALLIFLVGAAWASSAPVLHIQDVWFDADGAVNAVVYTTVAREFKQEDFQVKVGAREAVVAAVRPCAFTPEYAASYLILVDTPNLSRKNFAMLQETLTAFAEQIGAKDNLGLLRVGEPAADVVFSSNKTDITERVSALEMPNKAATLNASMIESIGLLETSTFVNARKVLIVVSTGEKRDETGATQSEVEARAAESQVTVYTLAMMTTANKERNQQANTFGAIARRSQDGQDIITLEKSANAAEIVEQIIANERRVLILSINAGEAQGGEALSISLRDGDSVATDTATLPPRPRAASVVLEPSPTLQPLPTGTPTAAPTQAPTSEPTSEPTSVPTSVPTQGLITIPVVQDWPLWAWLLIGAAVVCIGLLAMLLLVKRGKNRAGGNRNQAENGTLDVAPSVPAKGKRAYITFTPIDKSQTKATSCYIADRLVIGRNPSLAQIVIKEDAKVSGKHAMLTYSDGVMCIQDLGSTNGTRVNDRVITQREILKENDIITVGKTSLRVQWQERKA